MLRKTRTDFDDGRIMNRNAKIVGTGLFAPDRVVPNSTFNEKFGIDVDRFLREKRNIFERRYMADDQAVSDLILPAAQQAMKKAGVGPKDLDLIIVATDTPDYLSPSTASVVQHKLGATRTGTFDLNSACAGFVTALDVAGKFIKADERYSHVLVVGAYGMSKFLDWSDYKISSLFADGAGAVVLKAGDEDGTGILASQLYTDGQFHDYMGIYGGATRGPDQKNVLKFAKKIPLETNSTHWPALVRTLLDRIGARAQDVSTFFLTQINIQTIIETMDSLGVDRNKSHNIMDRFGYTGSACIPMALADADDKGKIKKGDLLMLVGSGGGVAMGALALRW